MTINKTRRSLGIKPGIVMFALLALGIVVTLGAINSRTSPAPVATTGDVSSFVSANRTQGDSPFSAGRYLVTIALLAIGGGLALYLRGRNGKAASGSEITLIERHQIRQGHELRLIEVGGDRILIGVSPNQLCVLHTAKHGAAPVTHEPAPTNDEDIQSTSGFVGNVVRDETPARPPRRTQSVVRHLQTTVRRKESTAGFAVAIAAASELVKLRKNPPAAESSPRPAPPPPGVYSGSGTAPFGSLSSFSEPRRPASTSRQHV